MDKLVVGEGRFARDRPGKICTEENIHQYRRRYRRNQQQFEGDPDQDGLQDRRLQ